MDDKALIAWRVAQELRPGMLVNLGIGLPTTVAAMVRPDARILFQSENGIVGMQATPEDGLEAEDLTDAGGRPISASPGAATFDSAMSFGLIRGGHVDVTVLGGLEVDRKGRSAQRDAKRSSSRSVDCQASSHRSEAICRAIDAAFTSTCAPRGPLADAADTLIPALPSAAAAPSTGWTARTA